MQEGTCPAFGLQPVNAGSMESTADQEKSAPSPAMASTGERVEGCTLKSMHSRAAGWGRRPPN